MSASDLLRAKFHSDRQLALYAQHGFDSTLQASRQVASDIYAGLERVSWYSSCLIPQYHNICKELFAEDVRMARSIYSIYRYRDVIILMIKVYIDSIVADNKEGNQQSKIRHADTQIAGFSATYATSKMTKAAVILAISTSISKSDLVSSIVAQKISKRLPFYVMLTQAIGLEQNCALAARRLKSLDPKYYALLYEFEVEMLYYYIEPIILKIIKATLHNYNIPYERAVEMIRREFNV
ncbi:TPA: hypothetical protein QDZ66_002608 [Pluralibacter gergoviae]|uniref:hypothetical protein n=1 Tax=Pluralibacter gergoviae TaxID=61647 RepID=UPI000A6BEA4E|nr:hypothetical protein [Pluralibacter gergoviae]MBL3692101.1 hypothetical protein [Pluralibacter gergoviae]HDS1151839.1 hypothetical protein [Pluralibacter gergoviae]